MVEVEVGVDDDVDVSGRDAGAGEVVEEATALVSADCAGGSRALGAGAGVYQDGLTVSADEEGVEAERHAVLVVEVRGVALPHDAGDEAEDGAGVLAEGAVADDEKLETAEAEPAHGGRIAEVGVRGQ